MGYSENNSIVRCDMFKLRVEGYEKYGQIGGKWFQTIALDMTDCYSDLISVEIERALSKYFNGKIPDGYTYVVIEPCHKYSHPICLHVPSKENSE